MLSNARKSKFDNACARIGSIVRAAGGAVRKASQCALPQSCVLCRSPCGNALVCGPCADAMPKDDRACPRCALASNDGRVCGACIAKPPPFDAAIAAWRYAFPADRLLQAFKYAGMLALAEPLACALADAIVLRDAARPDAVIAMPLSRSRQRERGFNHAHEIARRLAGRLDVPLVHALRRTRDAPAQAGLTLRERARNLRDAFEASVEVAGRSVAIVDDVMTTGATLRAAARALRSAGAARVDAWVVARTPPP